MLATLGSAASPVFFRLLLTLVSIGTGANLERFVEPVSPFVSTRLCRAVVSMGCGANRRTLLEVTSTGSGANFRVVRDMVSTGSGKGRRLVLELVSMGSGLKRLGGGVDEDMSAAQGLGSKAYEREIVRYSRHPRL